jgi:hypothetical protein
LLIIIKDRYDNRAIKIVINGNFKEQKSYAGISLESTHLLSIFHGFDLTLEKTQL